MSNEDDFFVLQPSDIKTILGIKTDDEFDETAEEEPSEEEADDTKFADE